MRSEDIVRLLENGGDVMMSKIITKEIKDHQDLATELKKNYDKYAGKVPILNRPYVDKAKISVNKKLANDFRGDIVDQINGFVLGESISVMYPDDNGQKLITDFNSLNSIDALNTELGEYMLSCGQAGRLLYVEAGTGEVRAVNLKPWEVIYIFNASGDRIDYALIYYAYTIVNTDTGKETKTIKVEWYDKENVTYFIKQGGSYVKEKGEVYENSELKEIVNPQPHFFDGVPIVKFIPNSREQTAFAKVEQLIDGYDEGLSDWLNEVIEFRNAYLKATGAEIDEDERKKARRTGIFNLPDKDCDVDFITKTLNPEYVENLLQIIDNNIYKFSKTVNMTSEKFVAGGAESGESRKWRMLTFVFLGIVIERYFTKCLKEQYRLVISVLNRGVKKINYLDITYEFTRKLPVDLLYSAKVVTELWGKLPKKIIYSLLPFIDNPQDVVDQLEEEENEIDLDKIELLKQKFDQQKNE